MSVSQPTATAVSAEPQRPARAPTRGFPWGRVVIVCAALVASGALRAWQADRIDRDIARGLDYSIDLKAFPRSFGAWKGEDTPLDPNIARGTGAKQVVTRRYVNQNTGVAVEVIMLFGQAVDMYIHMPELCYPKAGYTQIAGPEMVQIKAGPNVSGGEAPFRELVYTKGEGGLTDLQEVIYSWRYNGHWTPNVGVQKHFQRISGMYKIHVARRLSESELKARPKRGNAVEADNPCRVFLDQVLPEIETRIRAGSPTAPSTPAA
jgi:EpsI family protein